MIGEGHKISDKVWGRVIQMIQLAMLTGTDVIDHLRSLKVTFDPNTGEHVMGEGQDELFERTIRDLEKRIEGLPDMP